MTKNKLWPAQERQNLVSFQLSVEGVPDWEELFSNKITLGPPWSEWCGGTEVLEIDVYRKTAEVNDHSFEREVLGHLIDKGFVLKELEVEFDDEKKGAWGRCTWYKEHESYENPDDFEKKYFSNLPGFLGAMFETEHAGDQKFTLISTQMGGGFLFHKLLVFHRAVFLAPKEDVKDAKDTKAA